jgi:hypothetical protein
MLPALFLFLVFTGPPLVIWLLLGWLTRIAGVWRIVLSGFLIGALYSALLMWEDATGGFCCREYPATVWTEVPLYLLFALGFALACFLALGAVVSLTSVFRK